MPPRKPSSKSPKPSRAKAARPRAAKPVVVADEDLGIRHGLTETLFAALLEGVRGNPAQLDRLLADLHPADIADALERMPREDRPALLDHIPYERLGDVIAELDEGVRENVLQLLKPAEVAEALEELESDDAAEIARSIEELPDPEGPDAEDVLFDHQQKRLLNYDENTAGGLMQLELLTAAPDQTVGETLSYIRDNAEDLSDKPGTVFVVNPQRKLLGTVSISRLVKVPLSASLADVMRQNPLAVTPELPHPEVVQMFEKYDIHNLAVVNKRQQLLGRITIDDVLDVVLSDNARQQARAVGIEEEEDLFAPVMHTVKKRLGWLIINLGTAIAAAAVIGVFEDSIAKLTTLAILMPIVASMGGNATTQTQTVIIRALALGRVTRQNAFWLLRKELEVGTVKGIILGLLIAAGTWLVFRDPMLSLVIALATLADHWVAGLAGWFTPIILKRMGKDPAVATGVITTTFTDVGGFFTFLGLATLLLLH